MRLLKLLPLTAAGLVALLTGSAEVQSAEVQSAQAREKFSIAATAEPLFTSPNPKLNANKRVVYHIIRDLLVAGHWELADRYLSSRYLQHNPNAASGRTAVVNFFTQVLKAQPKPMPEQVRMGIVAVIAEGDLVVVTYRRMVADRKAPGGEYATTWFDMWRIKDGKADEHWDPALLGEVPDLR